MRTSPQRMPMASWLLAAQSAGLLAVAGWLASRVPGADIHNPGLLATLAVITAAAGVGIALAARGIARDSSWPRVPVVLLQIFIAVVALGLLQAGRVGVGAPLLALAVATATAVVRTGRSLAEPAS